MLLEIVNNSDVVAKFLFAEKYWQGQDVIRVKWISLKLRDVLEKLLFFDRLSLIDKANLTKLFEALDEIIKGHAFEKISESYPLRELMEDLRKDLQILMKKNNDMQIIHFKLPLQKKAKIIAGQFQIRAIAKKQVMGLGA